MILDREAALLLLPCYLCDDLPADVLDALEGLLADDAFLADRLELLRNTRDLCSDRLLQGAPDLTEWGAPAKTARPSLPTTSPTRPWGLLVGFAAAAMVTLFSAALLPPPAGNALAALHHAVAGDDARLLRAETPAELVAMVRNAGVSPQLAMVHDLSALGFSLVGVRVLGPLEVGAHPGVAIIYEKDGQRFVCQIQLVPPTTAAPEKTATVAGVVLRAYTSDSGSIVTWHHGGRWCVFGGPVDSDTLLAMVQTRMTSS